MTTYNFNEIVLVESFIRISKQATIEKEYVIKPLVE